MRVGAGRAVLQRRDVEPVPVIRVVLAHCRREARSRRSVDGEMQLYDAVAAACHVYRLLIVVLACR